MRDAFKVEVSYYMLKFFIKISIFSTRMYIFLFIYTLLNKK